MVSLNLKIGDLDPGAPELRPDSRYNRDAAFMVANYAASSDTYVVMVKTPQYQCSRYATLMKVDALGGRAAAAARRGIDQLASPTWPRTPPIGMNEGSFKWYELPRTQDMLNAITMRAPRELFNQNCDLLTVYVYLKDHKADTLTSVVNTVEAFAHRYGTDKVRLPARRPATPGIEAATNIVVKRANLQMLLLVYAAVIVLRLRRLPIVAGRVVRGAAPDAHHRAAPRR